MSHYKTLNHEKFILRYHLIFSTKYRKKCLDAIKEDLFASLKRAENLQNKWKIEVMEVDKDHIHFLIKATPTDTIFEIVHALKQVSTYDMWQQHYDYLSKVYWSGKHYLWTKGYFVSSIGDVSEITLKQSIERQG